MRLGIDASNISAGGGVTHLVEILNAAKPPAYEFESVIVWSSSATLNQLVDRSWLRKIYDPKLDGTLAMRFYWQRFVLKHQLHREKCDVLLVPGGTFIGSFKPFVTMSRNMLPFERSELTRYKISWMWLKQALLHYLQLHTFRRADGLIYLTGYAHDIIQKSIVGVRVANAVIPHGVSERFLRHPRARRYITEYSAQSPIRILYVSTVDLFKHQWHVAEAVAFLRSQQLPVHLDLVGAAYSPALKRLRGVIRRIDPTGAFINYHGLVPYADLYNYYHNADVFVFASSCENMPNILLEAMAAGLPIACSNRGPMPEVLGDAGVYFDPEKPTEIANAIRTLISDPILRRQKAEAVYDRSRAYSWKRCANETFDFIRKIVKETRSSIGRM